jgi:hypothetical protein
LSSLADATKGRSIGHDFSLPVHLLVGVRSVDTNQYSYTTKTTR